MQTGFTLQAQVLSVDWALFYYIIVYDIATAVATSFIIWDFWKCEEKN